MWNIFLWMIYVHLSDCMYAGTRVNLTDIKMAEDRTRYALMIDAGSTGSRMFVYTWEITKDGLVDQSSLRLYSDRDGNPLVVKITPGLSSFHNNILGVEGYVSQLLDKAQSEIPSTRLRDTPVFILATAGMRLLPQSTQDMIFDEVRRTVKNNYQFKFKNSYAETITGANEGLFGWIAINFILGTFKTSSSKKAITHGMLDMGGASMQIAYEVDYREIVPAETSIDFEYSLSTSQEILKYRIYAVSYLNYGANQFRDLYARKIVEENFQNEIPQEIQVNDPCINRGHELTSSFLHVGSEVSANSNHSHSMITVKFTGTGDFEACYKKVVPLLKVDSSCAPFMCSINGTMQPQINFQETEFYGLTEFFYAIEDFLPDEHAAYDYKDVLPKVKDLCAKDWQVYLEELRKAHPSVTEEKFNQIVKLKELACFKATYVVASLHVGFSFPKNYAKLHPVTHLQGTEIQWSLGALVYLLNSEQREGARNRFIIRVSILVVGIVLLLLLIAFVVAALVMERRRADANRSSYWTEDHSKSNRQAGSNANAMEANNQRLPT